MQSTRGIVAATLSYIIWGVLPIYWKSLENLPAYEILCHRMAWSLIIMVFLLFVLGRMRGLIPLLKDWIVLRTFFLSSVLLAVNWLIYIWAVNSGHIVEASLGYFINPLVTVIFGVYFLKERLRPGQIAALCFAAAGVAYLTFVYGRFPFIALILAGSFSIYGLIHKKTSVLPVEALFLETLMLFLPAAAVLLWFEYQGHGAIFHSGLSISLLLIGAGVVTTIPLLLFAYAAHNIPLSLLGILQYTAPTINLLLGILLYHEGFPYARMIGFVFVWSALAIYLIEGTIHRTRQRKHISIKP
jgi:chloramphenicol-sensitive protein RarD